MTRRIWAPILAIGVVLAPVHALAPDHLVDQAYVVVALLAASVLAVAVAGRPLARRGAWAALLFATLSSILGDLLWAGYSARGIEPFPSLADAAYLVSYPAYGLGLWWLGRRGRRTDRAALIDIATLSVAGFVLAWTYLLEPAMADSTLTAVERGVSLAYPLGDLILLPLVARLVFLHGGRVFAHVLVLGAMTAVLTADVTFGIAINGGWYVEGSAIDGLWLLGYVLLAAAAWHPSAVTEPPALPAVVSVSKVRLGALAFATVLAPVLLLVHDPPGSSVGWVAASSSIVLFLLVVGRMAALVRQVDEQAALLERLSRTDPLTDAANRRSLDEALTTAIARTDRGAAPFAFALFDLDRFKAYNDRNGHLAGDALLRETVARWHGELREADLLARFGGEEFALVLPDTTLEAATAVVERLRQRVPGEETCSAGVTLVGPGATGDEVIRQADDALYAAKAGGRDRIEVAAAARRVADDDGVAVAALA